LLGEDRVRRLGRGRVTTSPEKASGGLAKLIERGPAEIVEFFDLGMYGPKTKPADHGNGRADEGAIDLYDMRFEHDCLNEETLADYGV
jgi:hypothetical protein